MHCDECGKESPDGVENCIHCGASLVADPEGDDAGEQEARMSGKAIASLVLGLSSIIFCVFSALPGLILGILGLRDVRRSEGELQGEGLAAAGIGVSAFALVASVVVAGLGLMLLPALDRARDTARQTSCLNNMKQLGLALATRKKDEDALPETLAPLHPGYVDSAQVFVCPSDDNPRTIGDGIECSYRYSGPIPSSLGSEASRVVVAYDAEQHHRNGRNVLFRDWHAE